MKRDTVMEKNKYKKSGIAYTDVYSGNTYMGIED